MVIGRRASLSCLIIAISSAPALAGSGSGAPPDASATIGSVEASAYDQGAAGLATAIQRLGTRASLLTIVAHPDDEDGNLLTYEARGRGSRVAMLTLTRGEGGKNAMGPDLGDALGLIRTQETLAAGRIYGVEQLWGSVIDYGFSKSPEEALHNWGADRALADAVRAIRRLRPLVVTSTFVGGPSDGHGHHQLAGIAAQRAFILAGDPNAFPDQIREEGLRPWTPLKVYGHIPVATVTDKGMVDYANGRVVPLRFTNHVDGTEITGQLSVDVSVDAGRYFTPSGKSFAQIAREGMRAHRTQFPELGPVLPGTVLAKYHRFGTRVEAAVPERDLFDGIDTGLTGLANLASPSERPQIGRRLGRLQALVQRIDATFDARHPQAIAPLLADGLALTRQEIAFIKASRLGENGRDDLLFELHIKERQFEDGLALALGITVTAVLAPMEARAEPLAEMGWGNPMGDQSPLLTRGQRFRLNVAVGSQSASPVTLLSATTEDEAGLDWAVERPALPNAPLVGGERLTLSYLATVPEGVGNTQLPRHREGLAFYDLSNASLWGRSLAAVPLSVRARFRYGAATFERRVPVIGMQSSRTRGPFPVSVVVVPDISVALNGERRILPTGGGTFAYTVDLRNEGPKRRAGDVTLTVPAGWKALPATQPFDLASGGAGQVRFSLSTAGPVKPGTYAVAATARSEGRLFPDGFTLTGYDGLPAYPLYRRAGIAVSAVDAAVPKGLSVAYVTGTGDSVPGVLRSLGIGVDMVSPDRIGRGGLAGYDAVLIGVGAYGHVPELTRVLSGLREYARAGGVVVVQGPAGGNWPDLFPAPVMPGDKATQVTEEDSPVTLLDPADPLLRRPNAITPADFEGWVDQRGDDFPRLWAPDYRALLSMHDREQDAQDGALLDLRYGRGHFIYTALAFYRQLPAGVPGATRLLVNLLSRGRVETAPGSGK